MFSVIEEKFRTLATYFIMKILVTGANSQLAQSIKDIVAKYPNDYLFMDRDSLDITDREAVASVLEAVKPDAVINCAAYTKVDMAEDEPDLAFAVNCKGVYNLSAGCAATGALLVHLSTDYVFGGLANTPYSEDSNVDPLGIYGESKYQGELAVAKSGCDYLIIRTSWLYSAYGNNFLKTMLNLMKTRETVKVVFDQVGTPTYAGDLAEMILSVLSGGKLEKLKDHKGRIRELFHFSNEGVCSWFDFATEIKKAADLNCCVAPCHSSEFPSKVVRPAYSVLDKSKYCSTFGVGVPYWRDSLCKVFSQLRGNNR